MFELSQLFNKNKNILLLYFDRLLTCCIVSG